MPFLFSACLFEKSWFAKVWGALRFGFVKCMAVIHSLHIASLRTLIIHRIVLVIWDPNNVAALRSHIIESITLVYSDHVASIWSGIIKSLADLYHVASWWACIIKLELVLTLILPHHKTILWLLVFVRPQPHHLAALRADVIHLLVAHSHHETGLRTHLVKLLLLLDGGDTALTHCIIKCTFLELQDWIFYHQILGFGNLVLGCLVRIHWGNISSFEMSLDAMVSFLLKVKC